MGKIEDFINAVKNIKEDKERIEREDEMRYMSYMENWLCVHATNYKPKKNKNGQLSIQTTAMASGNKMARATVHVTLNHIVGGHMFGNWDSMPIVILAPYNDVVKENCDFIASINMTGKVNSLNASVSCGIVLSEIVSKRD